MDVFEGVSANAAGRMTDAEQEELEDVACPAPSACSSQYTANTMSTVMEFIGLSPLGFNSVPAVDARKDSVGERAGGLVMDVLNRGVRPARHLHPRRLRERHRLHRRHRWLDERRAHLLAMAREAGVPLTIDELRPRRRPRR
ncbi:MAG: dihydroxy-acid dehydratase [Dehalococcoidia bacterium]